MSFLARVRAWTGANLVPLILIPLALLLIWVALWRVWLPLVGGGSVTARAVTTVDANASAEPTHKVTTVVKTTSGSSPSRRSEVLALALVFLGAGAAVVGVFHNRIGSLELGKDGVNIDLDPAERSGAAALVGRLAAGGAAPTLYARGLDRYLRSLTARRPAAVAGIVRGGHGAGIDSAEAASLGERIADDLV
jgi:hypothetical protein